VQRDEAQTAQEGWNYCPVCGFDDLREAPWANGYGSQEICPCCGIQFGYEDCAGGDPTRRAALYVKRRAEWKASGMKWYSKRRPPEGWDPVRQLRRVEPN
jgi:hypothetical protein